MPKSHPILIVAGARVDLERLCGGDRALGRRCRILSWEQVDGTRGLPRSPVAVVLPDGRNGRGNPADLAGLRRRFPGVPILAVSGGRSVVAGADAALDAPLRAAEVEAVAARLRAERLAVRRQRLLRERLRRAQERLRALGEIARTASSILEPRRVTEITALQMRDLTRAEMAVIYRLEEDGVTLIASPLFARAGPRELALTLKAGEGAAGRLVQRRRPLRLGAQALARIPGEAFDRRAGTHTRSYLGAPLISRGRVIGAVELRNRGDGGAFGAEDQRALLGMVEPAAIVIDNALLFQRSQELSVTDDLTKLFNSRYLNDTLAREIKRARRYGAQVSLIFLDLDGFKTVNDQHGHLVGSRTLIEVGQVLREAVREIDVVSRYGGDEFTVVLPQTGPEGAYTIAERIRQAIAARVFMERAGIKVHLTASLGVASFPKPCDSPEELIQAADRAMYAVKAGGKDGVGVAP
jgi:diguanylate cyclase (GGDEF)-like protein